MLSTLALTFVSLCQGSSVSGQHPINDDARHELHDRLEAWWEGLDSVAFQTEEIPLDSGGEPDRSEGWAELHYARSSGGRVALRFLGHMPDGSIVTAAWEIADGRRLHRMTERTGHPGVIAEVEILGLPDPDARDSSQLWSSALWWLSPDGWPLHRWLEEGARVETGTKPDGSQPVVVLPPPALGVRLTLDRDHDDLPIRIEFPGGSTEVVRRFVADQGRWFPEEILKSMPPGAQHSDLLTRVGQLSINRQLAADTFHPPELEPGVLIEDKTNESTRFQGGINARAGFEARHPPKPDLDAEREADVTRPRLEVASGSEADWTSAWLTAASLLSLAMAFVFMINRSRN